MALRAQSSSPREKATPKKAKSPQPRNAAFSSGVASPSSGVMSPSGTAPSSAVGEKGKPGSLKQRATVKAIAAQRALARTLSFGKPAQMTSRRFAFIVAIPVLALVVPLCAPTKVGWCIYCMMVMYSYWATQALPIAVTSLLPVVIFPLTGIMSVDDTTSSYFDNAGITLFCALVASTAVEVSRLDQRIALNVTRVIGVEYGRLLLAVMLCTAFLSMWIPNTTVAAIVCPVVVAILKNLKECADAAEENRRGVAANVVFMTEETRLTDSRFVRLKKLMLLALAYSSSIGGTGSIIGTTANLILLEQVENLFPGSDQPTFASWMAYNVPIMLAEILVGWHYLRFLLKEDLGRAMTIAPETEERIMKDIQKRCDDLGHIRFSESVVTFLLTLMALLMFTQKPLFMQGWSEALPHSNMIGSSVPMVTVTLMLFMIPRETDVTGGDEEGIIKWEDVCQKVDWGTMLLVCGGLTIAKAATKSGLSARMVGALDYLEPIPASMVAASLCILASIMTELTSNRAVGRLLVPVVLEAAHYRNVHPLYFGLPTTIGCSFAFMLPCGTPPNAIVFNAGHMTTGDMVKPGIIMNGMCVIFQFAALHTLGTYLFNLNSFPEWAHQIVYQD